MSHVVEIIGASIPDHYWHLLFSIDPYRNDPCGGGHTKREECDCIYEITRKGRSFQCWVWKRVNDNLKYCTNGYGNCIELTGTELSFLSHTNLRSLGLHSYR